MVLRIFVTSRLLHWHAIRLVLLTVLRHASILKPILKLLLDRNNLFIEGLILSVVDAAHHVWIHPRITLIDCSLPTTDVNLALVHLLLLLLLNNGLDEGRLACEIYAMLLLKVVNIICQKALVVSQLLSDRDKADLVYGALGSHGFKRE